MRRSPLLAASLERNPGLTRGVIANMEIAFRSSNSVENTFLCDLSAVRKRLVVGEDTQTWLAEHIDRVPENIFHAAALSDEALAIRVHHQQWLVIDGNDSSRYDELFTLPTGAYGNVLLLDYECAEFALGGPQVDRIMSEFCPLPMADVEAHFWCATRMAHADVVIIPDDTPSRHYRIITTPADARFLYAIFSDALCDFGGVQIGFEQYWQEFRINQ